MLDPGCGNEAIEPAVLIGDASDESVQRGDIEDVDWVVSQRSCGKGASKAVELGAGIGEAVEDMDWVVLTRVVSRRGKMRGRDGLPVAPQSMRDCAMLRPMPRAPPVTTITFSARLKSEGTLLSWLAWTWACAFAAAGASEVVAVDEAFGIDAPLVVVCPAWVSVTSGAVVVVEASSVSDSSIVDSREGSWTLRSGFLSAGSIFAGCDCVD